MSKPPRKDTIEELTERLAECRELLREANGVCKDLRAHIKEAREERERITTDVFAPILQEEFNREIAALSKWGEENLDAMTKSMDSVFKMRLDELIRATKLGLESRIHTVMGETVAYIFHHSVIIVDGLPGRMKVEVRIPEALAGVDEFIQRRLDNGGK